MIGAPRGPIALGDGPLQTPDRYERDMQSWRQAALAEAGKTRDLCPENTRLNTYRQFIEGDHWQAIRANKPVYRSNFYLNKTNVARLTHLAQMSDTRPDIEVSCPYREYEHIAKQIDGVLRHEWTAQAMDLALVTAIDIAGIAGTAFWKNSCAAPGLMRVMPAGPDVVTPIQPGFSIQESTAVLYQTYKSLPSVLAKYPSKAKEIQRTAQSVSGATNAQYNRPAIYDEVTWQRLAPGMQNAIGRRIGGLDMPAISTEFFKAVNWQEFYIDDPSVNESQNTVVVRDMNLAPDRHNWWYEVAPGQPLYPRKRLVIFAGDAILYDGPSPYWHGLYPFSSLILNPVPWKFWGLSRYRDMIPVNSAINEIIAGVLDILKRIVNPIMVGRENAISPAAWKQFFPDMPGGKLLVSGPAANPTTDIAYLKNPELPAQVFATLQALGAEFKEIATMIDVAALGGKQQIPGGDTIEQMRDSLQAPQRLESRRVEAFITSVGVQQASNVLQFYDAKTRMAKLGPSGTSKEDYLGDKGNLIPPTMNKFDFWKNFPLIVKPGSMHGGAHDRKQLKATAMFQAGALSIEKYHEIMEISDPKAVELWYARMGAGTDPAMAGGGGPRLSRGARNGEAV